MAKKPLIFFKIMVYFSIENWYTFRLTNTYKDSVINHKYRADLVCYDKIIVEVKAVSKLANEHKAQVINYLKATGYKLGILVNFGAFQKLEYERIVLEKKNFNRE